MRLLVSMVLALVTSPLFLSPLAAQERVGGFGVSLGYLSALQFTRDDSLNLGASGNLALGFAITVPLGAKVALRMGGARTIEQHYTLSAPAFNIPETRGTLGVTHIGVSALLVPSAGRPRPGAGRIYLEAGVGLAMTTFGSVSAGSTSYEQGDFNTVQPAVTLGAGLAFQVGRRAILDISACLLGLTSYGSRGLDEWNGVSPPAHVKGRSSVARLLRVGVRHGRLP